MIIKDTIDYKDCKINICYDEYPESPREWDNLGTIYSNHRDYNLDNATLRDLIEDVTGDRYAEEIPWDAIAKKYYFQKVWMYDHSGQTVRIGENNPFGCPWDSGLFGVIAVSKEDAKKEYGYKRDCKSLRERAEGVLAGEIEDLDIWVRGDVLGFEIIDQNGESVDSCWGYFNEEQCIDDAKASIDTYEGAEPEGVPCAYQD